MEFVGKRNVVFDPGVVAFLGTVGIVLQTDVVPDLIKQRLGPYAIAGIRL